MLEMEKELLERVKLYPDDLQAYHDLARYYDARQAFSKAIDVYKRAIQRVERGQVNLLGEDHEKVLALLLFEAGCTYTYLRAYDKSQFYLGQALEHGLPDDCLYQCYYYLGNAVYSRGGGVGRVRKALAYAKQAQEYAVTHTNKAYLHELFAKLHQMLGRCDETARHAEQAVQYYSEAGEEDSVHAMLGYLPLSLAAECYAECNQPEKAIPYYEKSLATALASEASEQFLFAMQTSLGQAYYAAGNSSKAIVNFRAALAYQPEDDDLQRWIDRIEQEES